MTGRFACIFLTYLFIWTAYALSISLSMISFSRVLKSHYSLVERSWYPALTLTDPNSCSLSSLGDVKSIINVSFERHAYIKCTLHTICIRTPFIDPISRERAGRFHYHSAGTLAGDNWPCLQAGRVQSLRCGLGNERSGGAVRGPAAGRSWPPPARPGSPRPAVAVHTSAAAVGPPRPAASRACNLKCMTHWRSFFAGRWTEQM